MRKNFRNQLTILREHYNHFDSVSSSIRFSCLEYLSACDLPLNEHLIAYHDTLLFLHAHPSDWDQYRLTEKELLRITRHLKKHRSISFKKLINSGLPFTETVTRYSHDGLRWLLSHQNCTVELESFEDPAHHLNDVLRLTLPPLERSETTAGLNNEDLMDILKVPKKERLNFIMDEMARYDSLPYVKDHLFDRLDLFARVKPTQASFSRTFNRLAGIQTCLQEDWLRKIDASVVIQRPLPKPTPYEKSTKAEVIGVIKDAMAVRARETDPTTFMMESSLRIFHLERGISVAIYDMVPNRQLPLESYVGFTAFKNGYPVAYGGAWVFGHRAHFGINIFDAFRGGESAFILAQLLRTYRHVFDLHYFEIEPYQFGLDNPEGIESGAFWFYYRMGFRPLDRILLRLANHEAEKIKSKKGYRSPTAFLLRMTESSVALKIGKAVPPKLADILTRVTKMIQRDFGGRRLHAESACRQEFLSTLQQMPELNSDEDHVLTDMALWAHTDNMLDSQKTTQMLRMIREKTTDVYTYQASLRKFLIPA